MWENLGNGVVQEDIRKIEREREKYNKQHNLMLSYGQYVGMLYCAKLKRKEKRRG